MSLEESEWPTPHDAVPDPAAGGATGLLDLAHLSRQCLGDPGLADELLVLFLAQAGLVSAKLRQAALAPDALANLAHLVRGSAAAIGATQVAEQARQLEDNWRKGRPDADTRQAQAGLAIALDAACAAIAALRAGPQTA